MIALTNPDEHGMCHLLDMTRVGNDSITMAVFPIHENELPALVTMLVEGLTEEQRSELRDVV